LNQQTNPAVEEISMHDAIISADSGNITFIQIWRVSSEDDQERLLKIMHSRVGLLTKQPGFISMSLHASVDGKQTATYAQWRTKPHLRRRPVCPKRSAATMK
jgi:Antibiotic biosynthesis monooxygenase